MPNATPRTADRVLRVCQLLNRRRVRYLLAGGVAANLHGSVRATRDVGILVPREVRNTTRLLDIASKRTGRPADLADIQVLKPPRPRKRR